MLLRVNRALRAYQPTTLYIAGAIDAAIIIGLIVWVLA